MSKPKNPGLTRRASGLMALEQRFMFDGAAASEAMAVFEPGKLIHVSESPEPVEPVSRSLDLQWHGQAPAAQQALLAEAQSEAERLVAEFLSRPDVRDQLFLLFKGDQAGEQPSTQWLDAVNQWLSRVEQGDLSLQIELRSSIELQGAQGAFSITGTTGKPTIYLNQDWLLSADRASLTKVLVEELGHYIDKSLHPQVDTPGDEGERFARLVVDGTPPQPIGSLLLEDDLTTLNFEDQQIEAELASFKFINAYEMLRDVDGDGVVDNNENWAEKEQETHTIIFGNGSYTNGLGQVSFTDGTNNQQFSGNDVSGGAIGLVIGGQPYYGWISRPLKVAGEIKAFYFWTDSSFGTLAAAQADGNQDGDSNVRNNRGFILVVNQSYFDGLTKTSVTVSGAEAGTYSIAEVKSSSDRVDSALNTLVNSNAAPTAVSETASQTLIGDPVSNVNYAAQEEGYNSNTSAVITNSQAGLGNVLANDSDPNGDALLVTSVVSKLTGNSVTATAAGVSLIGKYGTLNIKTNGDWTYKASDSNAAVNALLSGNLQEEFTYTISDGKGGTATATLKVQINGSNDAPVAKNDYNTAREITSTNNTGYNATADALPDVKNVLANDSDVDSGDTKTVTGLQVKGSATSTSITAVEGTATLTLTATNNNIKSGDAFYVNISNTYYLVVKADGTTPITSGNQGGTTLVGLPAGYRDASGTYKPFGTTVAKFFTDNPNVAFNPTNYSNASNIPYTFTPNSNSLSTIATAQTSSYTTITNLSGITGTVAVGMEVSGGSGVISGTKVSAITYTGGVLTSIKLDQALTSTAGGTFAFTGSGGLSQTIQGAHGTLVLNSNGSYTYTPTSNNPYLNAGESAVEVFDYTMQDAAGVTSSAKLNITVYGSGTSDPSTSPDSYTAYESGVGRQSGTPYGLTQDNASFSGVNVTSDSVLSNDSTPSGTSGLVVNSYTKSDGSGSTNAGSDLIGAYGTLKIASNGVVTYTVANGNETVEALLPGQKLTEVFRYKVTNSVAGAVNWGTLTITIQGTNDLPVAVADAAAVSEDGVLKATGNVVTNDTDVDVGDTKVVSQAGTTLANTAVSSSTTSANGLSVKGTYGTLTIGSDGTYVYALDNSAENVQSLTQGQVVKDIFTYEVKDTNGATSTTTLTVDITGTNEAPINRFNGTAISSDSQTAVTTTVNSPIVFSSGNSKLLSVADADTNLSSITLEVEHGILSFTSAPSSVTLSANTGKIITISAGNQTQLNAALALLRYSPDENYTGSDFLSINSVDALGARDIDGIAINIPTNTTATVSEPALSSGSNASSSAETYSGSLTLASSQTILTQQTGSILNGATSIGTWQVNTNGTFSVTLTAASNATSTSFSYVVSDS